LVNSATGNLYFTALDISFKARGFNIEIVRAYNSHRKGISTGFGYGWTFNYHVYLVENAVGVSLVEGDGSVHNFTSVGGGRYSPPPGVHSRLIKNVDGSFTLWVKDGSRYNFDSWGRLMNIVDKNDNHLSFTYTDGKLTRVEDDSGLALILNYDPDGRISSVVDPLNRQIRYGYDADGNLKNVTDAMGYSILYFYFSDHKIKAIVDPLGRVRTFSYITQDDVDKVSIIGSSWYHFILQTYSLPSPVVSIEYDTAANFVKLWESGHLTLTVKLNDDGNPIQFIDALGGVTSMN
jgi:YD repeat-containing protein